ncbi:MAG: hypothetical protein HQL15_09935, partial [Candidatus Omnitrophica bacterium]|nr:hypothetical protein [Candidatus Omnitrophota bacterium]
AYEKTDKELFQVLRAVPAPFTEDDLISYVTQLAKQYHISIIDFQPPGSEGGAFYREMTLSFTCSSTNFKDAMLFLNGIENSRRPLKINSWSAVSKNSETKALKDFDTGLAMTVVISSIELMDYGPKKQK